MEFYLRWRYGEPAETDTAWEAPPGPLADSLQETREESLKGLCHEIDLAKLAFDDMHGQFYWLEDSAILCQGQRETTNSAPPTTLIAIQESSQFTFINEHLYSTYDYQKLQK